MPDGVLQPTSTTAPEQAAEATDARLIRRVRRNLVLFSGGTTLVVLLLLGVALYLAVAGSLANSGVGPLREGMAIPRAVLTGQRPDPGDESPYGFQFGSPTFAFAIDEEDRVVGGPRDLHLPPGLPNDDAVAASRRGGQDLRTATVNKTPVRILTETFPGVRGIEFTVQVVQDRTAEQRTLDTMLIVLIVGAMVVVAVAFGFGAVYARRALVPIREPLANQRSALRRH